jgi:hypothetical protein
MIILWEKITLIIVIELNQMGNLLRHNSSISSQLTLVLWLANIEVNLLSTVTQN